MGRKLERARARVHSRSMIDARFKRRVFEKRQASAANNASIRAQTSRIETLIKRSSWRRRGNAEERARGQDLPVQYNTQRGSQASGNGCCPVWLDGVTSDGTPDGGAISGLWCLLGYTRYRSGNREHRIKTSSRRVDTDAAERRPGGWCGLNIKWSERTLSRLHCYPRETMSR